MRDLKKNNYGALLLLNIQYRTDVASISVSDLFQTQEKYS